MYGTIAHLKVKPGKLEELKTLGTQEGLDTYPDIVFEHIYQSDADSNEVWLVVGFTSREAYKTNADSPEQHQRYMRLRSLLDADPEWHDGEVVWTHAKA